MKHLLKVRKATGKLILKKELLRTLDEGHLRVVNGGKVQPSYFNECNYDIRPVTFSELLSPPEPIQF